MARKNSSRESARLAIARYLVVVVLLGLSGLKWAMPYSATYALPAWGYHASAVLEVCLAAMIWSRLATADYALLCFACIAILVSLVHDGDCG